MILWIWSRLKSKLNYSLVIVLYYAWNVFLVLCFIFSTRPSYWTSCGCHWNILLSMTALDVKDKHVLMPCVYQTNIWWHLMSRLNYGTSTQIWSSAKMRENFMIPLVPVTWKKLRCVRCKSSVTWTTVCDTASTIHFIDDLNMSRDNCYIASPFELPCSRSVGGRINIAFKKAMSENNLPVVCSKWEHYMLPAVSAGLWYSISRNDDNGFSCVTKLKGGRQWLVLHHSLLNICVGA